MIRPRRSLLFMPGSNPRALEKARILPADVISLDSPWWMDDLTMAAKARPGGILVPKISGVADFISIARCLSDIGAPSSIRVWAMIETANAVLHAEALAAASPDFGMRLAGFVFGPNDISRETRIRMLPGRAAMIPMITHCILATRAHGLEILDGPYSDFSNVDGFALECAQARDLGFDGKTLIHPGQIVACNAIFTPPAE